MLTLRPPMVLGLNLGAMARYVAAAVLLAALVAPCDCDCVCVGSGYSDADGYRGSGYADADGYCTGPAVAGDLRVFGEVLEDSCSTAVVAAPDPYPTCTHTCCTGAGAACVIELYTALTPKRARSPSGDKRPSAHTGRPTVRPGESTAPRRFHARSDRHSRPRIAAARELRSSRAWLAA